jgi:hypothetical protein
MIDADRRHLGHRLSSQQIGGKTTLPATGQEFHAGLPKGHDLAAKGEGDKAISMRYDDKKQDYVVRLHKARKDKT